MNIENYLKLTGLNERVIHNSFWTQKENSSKLAIFFPGFSYPPEAPLDPALIFRSGS
ncbi:MAG: hypothetical protein PF518_01205 [Spirochaetaceae bacterium]|jgi:hypothetical protein|nr:hypothetical protein [Spirochaetaceae bacterium]